MRVERVRRSARAWLPALAWVGLAGATLVATRPAAAEDSLEDRRTRIREMPLADKQELLEHEGQLSKLDPAEQSRLRELSKQVEASPNAEGLRKTMRGYYDWLRTLQPYERAELAELPPAKRVAKIKELLAAEAQGARGPGGPFRDMALADRYRRLAWVYGGHAATIFRPADMEGLLTWLEKYVREHGSKLLEKVSSPHREELKKQLAQATDPLRKHEVRAMILLRWRLENPKATPLTDADLRDLRSDLSEPTRERLERMPPGDQWRVVSGLITAFVLSQAAARRADAPWPLVSEEELAQFFQDELNTKQRDQLLKLPPEMVPQELLGMYLRWKLYQVRPPEGSPWDRRFIPPGPPTRPDFGPSGPGGPNKGQPPEAKSDGAGKKGRGPGDEGQKSGGQ